MSEVTNQLVGTETKRRLGLSAGAVLTTALAVSVLLHESPGHAASVAAPMDDNSVAALTALDHAVESVASRVEPAVVNVQVTSRGSEEETAMRGGGQGGGEQQLPPGFAQFFGPGGPFGNGAGSAGARAGAPLSTAAAAARAWRR